MLTQIINQLFGREIGWPRYFMPRTGYTLFGSLYFLFTFQFTLFICHAVLEMICLALFWIIWPYDFTGWFLPRLFIPFLMVATAA